MNDNMKFLKASILILLASSLSFADLNYNFTLGTNKRNSGPKVAVAEAITTGIFVLAYWWFVGRDEPSSKGTIEYPDRVEEVK
jgi:hypothetical protein